MARLKSSRVPKELRDLNVTIFPSLCYISLFQNGNYKLGAQDVSEFDDKEKKCKNFEWGIIYIETIRDIHIGSGSFIIIKFNGDIQAWNKK